MDKDEFQMLSNLLLKIRHKYPLGEAESKWVLDRIEERLNELDNEALEK